MLLIDIYKRVKFCIVADRIGPDLPFTHWKLHYNTLMLRLCKKKFKKFPNTAQFRPGAYAIGCSRIEIGERVIIRPNCMLFGESLSLVTSIKIHDDVMLGSGVHIYIKNHKFENPNISIIDQGYYNEKQVILKKGCWIGANSIILPGVIIGENSVIGAGSIVTKSIPAGVVAVGNPAIVKKRI